MSYLGRSAKLSLKAQEKVSFLATAGQTVKTGLSYVPSFVEVYVNGILLTDTTDFTATNGNSVTFTVALALNDEVTVISLKTFSVADHYTKTEDDALLAAKATIASPSFTGKVGIGSSSPVRQLEIKDDGTIGQAIVGIIADAGDPAGIFMGTTSNNNVGGIRYFTDTNKLSLRANDEDRLLIDSAGIVTKPYQPSFKVHQNNTTLSSAGLSTVSFSDSETYAFDNGNNFSSNIFTAPVAGKYFFAASLRVDGLNDYFRMVITQNDRNDYSSDIHAIYNPNSSVNFHSFAASGILNLAANDTVRVNISSTNDSSWISQGEGTFSGYLLG